MLQAHLSQIPSPCFVLEEKLLRQNLAKLASVSAAAGVEIILALKGFSLYHVFPLVKQYLNGATASSLNEALLIEEYMHDKAHTYCPVYYPQHFDKLLPISKKITFNSLQQWELYKEKVNKAGVPAALRINPEYSEVSVEMYNPCVAGSRLGVRPEDLINGLPEGISGLHFHALCENNSFTLEKTLASVEEKYAEFLPQISWFNMGGGHLITHKDYDTQHLIHLLQSFQKRYPNIREIILEPGAAIAWQTGVLVTQVLDIVESKGIKVAMLDVSFAAHMPDTLEMPYQPYIRGAVFAASETHPFVYRMGGTTCLAGDFMGDYAFENSLQIGDKLILEDMMHYTMVKTTTFNGVPLPNIGLWQEENNTFKNWRTFGYESYKDRLG
ncbi:MAG: carboxynorspermidine decarboxylase [Chitinophagales bacterium]